MVLRKRGKVGRAMSRTLQSAILTGRARVKLRDGSVYVGWVSYTERAITIEGRLRVTSSAGVTYRPLRRRTVPMYRVHEVLWSADPEQA
jgi:hypothetical protein